MGNILANETWINRTENYSCGESDVYETRFETTGEAFKGFRDLYGRCIGKVLVDTKDGEAKQVGWVFQKRQKYTDTNETFLAETWVTLHAAKPDRIVRHHYADF